MNQQLKYVPVFRGLQQEFEVLKSFDFGDEIYPCLEIIKELDRKTPQPRKNSKKQTLPKPEKSFEDVYVSLINKINANRVFIDLPVQLKASREMKPETLQFLRTVLTKRDVRTAYMKKFDSIAGKVIPVISTYYQINAERGSIFLQEQDLRTTFKTLAFRTFLSTFNNDILQIKKLARNGDYVFMDWEDIQLDLSDEDQLDIINELKQLKCSVISHRNPFPNNLTYVGLTHGEMISSIDNSLSEIYPDFAGSCFSDYAGI
jgi:hypothetical protein